MRFLVRNSSGGVESTAFAALVRRGGVLPGSTGVGGAAADPDACQYIWQAWYDSRFPCVQQSYSCHTAVYW